MTKPVQDLEVHPGYGKKIAQSKGFKRLRHRILPRHTYLPLKDEVRLALLRLKSGGVQRRFRNARDLLVNVGCGSQGKTGWVNVDAGKAPGVNCVFDCRKNLPFPDNSVRGIFCEHFMEHIDYTEEAPYFVFECHRVLKEGGVLRVIVPDAEQYLKAYGKGGWEELTRVRGLDPERRDPWFKCRYNTRMELINVLFRQGHEHKYAYDFETLEFLLRRYGFAKALKQEFGKSLMPELGIDQLARASESLYVEAVK